MKDLPEHVQTGGAQAPGVPPKRRGIARLIAAAGYSFAGLRSAFASEEAFRLEVVVFVLFTPVALYLGENGVERALLIGVLLLVSGGVLMLRFLSRHPLTERAGNE